MRKRLEGNLRVLATEPTSRRALCKASKCLNLHPCVVSAPCPTEHAQQQRPHRCSCDQPSVRVAHLHLVRCKASAAGGVYLRGRVHVRSASAERCIILLLSRLWATLYSEPYTIDIAAASLACLPDWPAGQSTPDSSWFQAAATWSLGCMNSAVLRLKMPELPQIHCSHHAENQKAWVWGVMPVKKMLSTPVQT